MQRAFKLNMATVYRGHKNPDRLTAVLKCQCCKHHKGSNKHRIKRMTNTKSAAVTIIKWRLSL
jgi:hypothetical protein